MLQGLHNRRRSPCWRIEPCRNKSWQAWRRCRSIECCLLRQLAEHCNMHLKR
ncbi:hypothetical protein Mapa_005227 [Marchantia paleacea]|nr:hypothetical protein Mapa_005227 [Marchantia paleacea]